MKILFVNDSLVAWKSGIWLHRNNFPTMALKRRGHAVKEMVLGTETSKDLMEWPDTVIFGRAYPINLNPVKLMNEYKKLGARVLYDIDDDFWQVSADNPSNKVSNANKDQYEEMVRTADAVITPSKVLAKKVKALNKKKAFICPNTVDMGELNSTYQERPHNDEKGLTIGYMGAASHWKDLHLIGEVLRDLSKHHDFTFVPYGLTGGPLESEMFSYHQYLIRNLKPETNEYFRNALDFYEMVKGMNAYHIAFHTPELHPTVLSKADFDIGLAPLYDTEFNRGKSCIKFYEYAAVGTVTLASNVLPYKDEVNYTAKNTYKDWYKKIEKLIVDKEFRLKTLKKQQDWVMKNRSWDPVGIMWELACQKKGGLKVLNQQLVSDKMEK